MTEEDKNLLKSFEGKLRHILFLFEEQKKENIELRQVIKDKNAEIQALKGRINELEAKYTNLKMARMISVNDDEIRDTKQRLTRLVREVDKCIALLNE